jgi:hypothetical protein
MTTVVEEPVTTHLMTGHPCPCPYNSSSTRNGSICGERSVYSRPGSVTLLCYPSDDFTDGMLLDWKRNHVGYWLRL